MHWHNPSQTGINLPGRFLHNKFRSWFFHGKLGWATEKDGDPAMSMCASTWQICGKFTKLFMDFYGQVFSFSLLYKFLLITHGSWHQIFRTIISACAKLLLINTNIISPKVCIGKCNPCTENNHLSKFLVRSKMTDPQNWFPPTQFIIPPYWLQIQTAVTFSVF